MEVAEQESLGKFLQKTREEKNISIEQVAYATRISLKMLRALETDDHSALPAPTFVRGYLQAYAKSVRLDTQDLLLRYQHHLATEPGSKKNSLKSHYLYVKERYQEKKRMLLVSSLLVLLVLSGSAYFVLKSKRDRNKQLTIQAQQLQRTIISSNSVSDYSTLTTTPLNTEKTKEPKEKPHKVSAAALTPAPSPISLPSEPQPVAKDEPRVEVNKVYNLELRADQDVWIRCQTDDEPVKERMIYANKSLTLHANKVIKIFSGNLGALHASMNKQEIPSLMNASHSKSVVLPESEAPNYPLPLFPEQQKQDQRAAQKAAEQAMQNKQTSSDTLVSP